MKKIILTLFTFFFIGSTVYAQTFQFVSKETGEKMPDTLVLDATKTQSTYFHIKNLTQEEQTFVFVGYEQSQFAEGALTYCYPDGTRPNSGWGECANPGKVSNEYVVEGGYLFGTVSPKEDLYASYAAGSEPVYYALFIVYDPSDSLATHQKQVIKYEKPTNDIKSPEKSTIKVDVYPNPASDNIKIKYDVNGAFSSDSQLIIRNLVGSVVKTIPLKSTEKEVTASVSELSSGIYFYSLSIDGAIQNTKKLIIKK